MKRTLIFLVLCSVLLAGYNETNETGMNYTLVNGDCIKDLASNNTYCWGIILMNSTAAVNSTTNYTTIDNITIYSNEVLNCRSYNDSYNLSEGENYYDVYTNRTYICEVKQFNNIISKIAGESYEDIIHNLTFQCLYKTYNLTIYASCGQSVVYQNENLTFVANCSNATYSTSSCMQNVSYNITTYGSSVYNSACNITCYSPPFPKINLDYTADYESFQIFDQWNLTVRGPKRCEICPPPPECQSCECNTPASYALEPNQTKKIGSVDVFCKERTLDDWFNLYYYNKSYEECNESEKIPVWSNGNWIEVCPDGLVKYCKPEEIMRKDGVIGVCVPRLLKDAKDEWSKCNTSCTTTITSSQYYSAPSDNSYEQFSNLCLGAMIVFIIVGWGVIGYHYLNNKGFISAIKNSKNEVGV